MTRRPVLLILWLLTVPGFAILAALAVLATPVFGLLGCRTAGIMSITCDGEFVLMIVKPLWVIVLVAASFPFASAPVMLFTLGFAGWRVVARRRARRKGA